MMTRLAGALFFDCRPTGEVTGTLARAFHDSTSVTMTAYARDGIAMIEAGADLWTGADVRRRLEPSPAGIVLTFDGRIDNRDDLVLRFGRDLLRSAPDAAIAQAAFERYGVNGLALLVGEWSTAIWDARHRTLHVARDYMGTRPLFYCVDHESVSWSSSLGELVERTGRAEALSRAFVASFMTSGLTLDVTPYENVQAVPAAHCVSVGAAGEARQRRFWSLAPGQIRLADGRAYEEQLRALWREAVGVRLRTAGTVWAELSGGLDSSSVVCMADALIKRRMVPARAIRLVSHVTLHSPEGDERRFIAEVERQAGVRSDIIGVEENLDAADDEWGWVTPYALQGVGLAAVRRIRAAHGQIVLSGRLGDAVMGCSHDNSVAVLDDFSRGDVAAGLRNLRAWSRACRKPFAELAWRLVRSVLATPSGRAHLAQVPDPGAALLTPELRRMTRTDPLEPITSPVRASKRALARMLIGYSAGARLDAPLQPPDMTYAYPFTHRPLVEFMLAIPAGQLSAPGVPRSLMRRAFADLVPARVLRRVSKGYYPPAAFRAARQVAESMRPAERLETVRRGWIDPGRLEDAIRVLTDGGGQSGGEIYCVLRLEQWLQARSRKAARRAPADIPQRKEVRTNAVFNP